MIEQVLQYTCRLCGWEFGTINGLWAHIPSHTVTQAVYGTLVAAEAEVAALSRELEAARECHVEKLERARKAEADLDAARAHTERLGEIVAGYRSELDAARAEGAALRAAGDELTKHLDHDNSDCAPMYGCVCGCLEALEAWRALARPEPAAGEGSVDA